MKRIGLARRRRAVGMTQEMLAEQLGVDRTTIIRWERGMRAPLPQHRPNLAMALKVSAEELAGLLGDVDEEQSGEGGRLDLVPRVNPSRQVANAGLDALIRGAGYSSLERFAQDVNRFARKAHGIKTDYDHVAVKRWLAGSPSDTPDAVAAVLADAWGVPVPAEVVWPAWRDGKPPAAAHLQPWVAERTLKELAIFVRRDMLTRRETLASAVQAVSGSALLAPIAGWLSAQPGRLEPRDHGTQRIGAIDVEAIERSTRFFAATDADIGGVFSREAAVGQLKHAVDLARHASYSEATGNRLLAAIAELSGLVGWLCCDSGMAGPAQQYFTFGLQAARESADPRSQLLLVSILADVGEHLRWIGRPNTALQMHDLALAQLPADPRLDAVRGLLITRRAEDGLCHLGPSHIPEVRDALDRSFDLYGQASDEDRAIVGTAWHRVMDTSVAELAASAAVAYLTLAEHDPRLAAQAEKHTMDQIASVRKSARGRAFGHIRLARIRFLAGEAEQACDDGEQALGAVEHMRSATVQTRLRELLPASEPYADVPRVVEFRDRLRGAIPLLN